MRGDFGWVPINAGNAIREAQETCEKSLVSIELIGISAYKTSIVLFACRQAKHPFSVARFVTSNYVENGGDVCQFSQKYLTIVSSYSHIYVRLHLSPIVNLTLNHCSVVKIWLKAQRNEKAIF